MELTPREKDKLLLFSAAQLAGVFSYSASAFLYFIQPLDQPVYLITLLLPSLSLFSAIHF